MEENSITSVQNARIKHVVALQQKSSLRREEGLFVVEGQREIEHCIACGYEISELYVLDTFDYAGSLPATRVAPLVYEKMAYRGSTEGMIAVARSKDHSIFNLQSSIFNKINPLIMVLESVEKPGNLGAILRTAEAAGVDAVIVCDPLTDLYNPNLIRASIGGVFCVPTAVCTSQECIAFLKEHGVCILTAQLPWAPSLQDSPPSGARQLTPISASPCWVASTPSMSASLPPSSCTRPSASEKR